MFSFSFSSHRAPMASAKRRRIAEPEDGSIPHDVLFTHIFPKLPAKTLIRFRVVCKLWLSLLRDPLLAKLHSSCSESRAPPETSIVVSFTDRRSEENRLFFADASGRVNPRFPIRSAGNPCVSQVVNGLICLINPDSISVCNLTTREIINLPVPSSPPTKNPSQTHHSCFLFGFDSKAYEYKVLKINTVVTTRTGVNNPSPKPKTRNNYEVITLGTNSWREIKAGRYRFSSLCKLSGARRPHIQSICVNNAIHWIQNPDTSGKRRVSVFDIASETFLPGIPFPSHLRGRIRYPIEIGGRLALADCRYSNNHDILSIWVLEDHLKQVWTYYRVNVLSDLNRPRCIPVGSSSLDKIYLVRGGSNKIPFQLLCFDLVDDPNNNDRPWEIRFKGLPEDVADIACIRRLEADYFSNLGGLDSSLALFITDKMDNMFPLKIGV